MSSTTKKAQELKELKAELGEIELNVLTKYTLGDAILDGSLVTVKAEGWGDGNSACSLHAALIAARSHGLA